MVKGVKEKYRMDKIKKKYVFNYQKCFKTKSKNKDMGIKVGWGKGKAWNIIS
jgi:hypothetical protein